MALKSVLLASIAALCAFVTTAAFGQAADKPHDVVEGVAAPTATDARQVPEVVPARPLALLEPEGKRIYHGVCINAENAADYPNRLATYSALVGHRPSVGVQFAHAFDAEKALTWDYHARVMRTIDREGLIVFMKATTQSWNSAANAKGMFFKADDILGGKHEAFFIKAAQVCRDFGKPMFITWNHEMNGDWYTYSEVRVNKQIDSDWTAEKYIQFHRYVWMLFKEQGATNVAFGFSPCVIGRKLGQLDELHSWKAYYPGDEYVDWMAPSYYNNDNPIEMDIIASEVNKPIFVSEWGTSAPRAKWYRPQPYPGDAAWMATTLEFWMNRYPNLKGSAYYQWEKSYQVQRVPEQFTAYVNAIGKSMFIHGPEKRAILPASVPAGQTGR